MIRPLRRLHRAALTALALALPLAFGLAIGARPPAPTMAQLPGPLGAGEAAPAAPAGAATLERDDLFERVPARLRLWAGPGRTPRVELRLLAAPTVPELLAYWSATGGDGPELPGDAVLLGATAARAARAFDLPVAGAPGFLLLYSLGHGEVVDRARLPAAPGGAAAMADAAHAAGGAP